MYNKSCIWASSETVSINLFPVYGPYFLVSLHILYIFFKSWIFYMM